MVTDQRVNLVRHKNLCSVLRCNPAVRRLIFDVHIIVDVDTNLPSGQTLLVHLLDDNPTATTRASSTWSSDRSARFAEPADSAGSGSSPTRSAGAPRSYECSRTLTSIWNKTIKQSSLNCRVQKPAKLTSGMARNSGANRRILINYFALY